MKMWQSACSGLLLQLLCTTALVHNSDRWGDACPAGCICHNTTYTDLPMKRWLHEGTTQISTHETPPPHNINEVVYTEEEPINQDDMNEQLNMAMCIIQKDTDVQTMFALLPPDIQVLTILQSRGSGDIYLEATHLQSLQLIALDIQGFHQDAHNSTASPTSGTGSKVDVGKIIVRSDSLQFLSTLQYLNLQHIQILGNPNLGNRPAPYVQIADSNKLFPNSIPIGAWYNDDSNSQQPNDIPSQIVLLQPVVPKINEEILPYNVYKEQQERAGMSVFSTLNNLLFLRVHGCGLKEVNWEMFTGLNKLEYLSLEKNNLLFIPDFTFYGAANLKTLSLAHNKLLGLHSTGLAGLLDLQTLDLSYNNFSHLSELSLPPFPKLQKADFRGNPIQEVFASTFEIMNATKELFLGSKNSEFSIQTNSFLGLDSLTKLNLLNVNIPILERDLLRGMPTLQHLHIKGSIKSLSFDAFLEMPKLEELVVRSCGIESVSMDAFYGLYGLLYLDLSHNLIASLPPGVFDQQFSLKELRLENNLLTELPLNIFGNLPAKVIRLTGNPWDCTCAMHDWKPAVINGRKQAAQEFCQFQYDKGSTCDQLHEQYVYDRSVAPRCATPTKYKNWSVFTALRKQLHCDTEKHAKFRRKDYLRKKHEEYEQSLNSGYFSYSEPNRSSMKQLQQPGKIVNSRTNIRPTNSGSTAAALAEENKINSFNQPEPNTPTHGTITLSRKSQSTELSDEERIQKSKANDNNTNSNSLATSSTNTSEVSGPTAYNTGMKPMTVNSPAETIYQNDEQSMRKAKLEKRQRLQEKYEQTKKKEKMKSEATYVVYDNKKPIKVSKKAWKMELEKTRQAKLRQQSHLKKS